MPDGVDFHEIDQIFLESFRTMTDQNGDTWLLDALFDPEQDWNDAPPPFTGLVKSLQDYGKWPVEP